MKPKALIFAGYGLNCDEETKFGFDSAGAVTDIVHINDLIDGRYRLKDYQIMIIQGGFSYGDDTGSGNAYANKIKNHLWKEVVDFIQRDKLVIGICNGFQILVNLGLLPSFDKHYGERDVALIHNDNARYTVRFTDLKVENQSPWLCGISTISLPIAHGEGKFYASNEVLLRLRKRKMIALRYFRGETSKWLDLPPNPNGSLEDIAGICDESGRVFGLMPHPERAQFFHQMPHWTYLKEKLKRAGKKVPTDAPGLQIFRNAVKYFTS